jgi:hypothetical protein
MIRESSIMGRTGFPDAAFTVSSANFTLFRLCGRFWDFGDFILDPFWNHEREAAPRGDQAPTLGGAEAPNRW